jgi:hypothetical protein
VRWLPAPGHSGASDLRTGNANRPPECFAASSHCTSQASASLVRDCRTLIDLKDDLDPNGVLNWSESLDMANWEGVLTSEEKGVLELGIQGTALHSIVPTGLSSLPNLRLLNLSWTGLTGSIPAALGSLSNLDDLLLEGNELTGSIPTGLGHLSTLDKLNLTSNRLRGRIPSDFGSLTSLGHLSLNDNFLGLQTHPTATRTSPGSVRNPVPSSLGDLSNLVFLDLSEADCPDQSRQAWTT